MHNILLSGIFNCCSVFVEKIVRKKKRKKVEEWSQNILWKVEW